MSQRTPAINMSQRTPATQEGAGQQIDRIKVLSNEIRRLLLGLLYSEGPMYHSDIAKHIDIKPNLLAYHLDLLLKANLITRKYASERQGQNFSQYMIIEDGERFLELIGAKDKLNPIIQVRHNKQRERSGGMKTSRSKWKGSRISRSMKSRASMRRSSIATARRKVVA